MRGRGTERYIHLSNIHVCMHVYTGKLHRLKKKTKHLFAVINIKLNLHCFTKLPSLQYQARVCVESAIQVKPCETDEAHTTKEERCHYV